MKTESTKEKMIDKKMIAKYCIFCIASFLLCFSVFFNSQINSYFNKLNFSYFNNCKLTVHFLDVGQADCTIIQFPDNEIMVIDAGAENQNNATPQYICDYIKFNFNKTKIKYLILTHSDEDHCLAIPLVLNEFEVENIFRPATRAIYDETEIVEDYEAVNICDSPVYAEVINKINSEPNANISVSQAGLMFKYQNVTVEFLAPSRDKYLNGESSDALNAISAVVQLTYKNKRFLFTGDSNEYNETELLNSCSDIDILKVAHHGSSTSTTESFLNITNPEYAIISVGADNTYNMPSSAVYERLLNFMNADSIYRTDMHGTIVCGVGNNSILFKTFNYQNNKIVWWQIVIVSEILLVIITFVPMWKKFND